MKYDKETVEKTRRKYEKSKEYSIQLKEKNEKNILGAYSNLFENLDTYKNMILPSKIPFIISLSKKVIKSRFENVEKKVKKCISKNEMADKNCEMTKYVLDKLEASPTLSLSLEDAFHIAGQMDKHARFLSKPLDVILDLKEQKPVYYNIRKNLIDALKEQSIL